MPHWEDEVREVNPGACKLASANAADVQKNIGEYLYDLIIADTRRRWRDRKSQKGGAENER